MYGHPVTGYKTSLQNGLRARAAVWWFDTGEAVKPAGSSGWWPNVYGLLSRMCQPKNFKLAAKWKTTLRRGCAPLISKQKQLPSFTLDEAFICQEMLRLARKRAVCSSEYELQLTTTQRRSSNALGFFLHSSLKWQIEWWPFLVF